MRIALLSDIHGNSIALDAVLDDIKALGDVTDYWILGDLAALGPDPVGVLDRLSRLEHAVFVRGNTDHYLVADQLPGPHVADVEADIRLLPLYGVVARHFGWTQGAVTSTGWFDWLAALPVESRLTLPDGTRLLGVHASPGQQDGSGIHPQLSDAALRFLLADCHADLICVGHTHWPMNMHVDGCHVVNLGCVSNPLPPDLRACYVILDADDDGYRVQHRRVDYDRAAVIEMIRQVKHPSAQYLIEGLQGLHNPRWHTPNLAT